MVAIVSRRPKAIVLMGAPGVGKGTYASLLSKWLGFDHISTGDAIRQSIKTNAPGSEQYKQYVEKGELLPNSIVFPLVKQLINNREFILMDGFPRQESQIAYLDKLADVKMALWLKLKPEILIEKALARRVCSKCGQNYNLANIEYGTLKMPPLAPKVPGICDKCHGSLYQREDDHLEVVQKRLQDFDKVTDQLIQAYEKRGILVPFELTGGKRDMWPVIQKLFLDYGFAPDRDAQSENDCLN